MAKRTNVDMFSYLTDTLILIVISFLPFKEAAKTSLLSKRWRNLWRGTKKIEFDQSLFVKQESEESNQGSRKTQKRVFLDFCKLWVGTYPQLSANEFRLALSDPQENDTDTQLLIRFAVDRGVKALDLDFSRPTCDENQVELFELPLFVYEHIGLESLALFSCNFRVSLLNKFLALKSLSLGGVKLTNSCVKDLVSNCPLLESLSLKNCSDLGCINISSTRLRNLVIEKCSDLENGIVVDVPNLRVLKYSGLLVHFEIEYMKGLVEADFDFGFETEFGEYGDLLYQLLGDVWSARVLTVCSYMLQVIPSAEEYPSLKPPFEGVQHLTLKAALDVHEFHGISFFLNSCPHLETLTIDLVPARIFQERGTDLAIDEHEFMSSFELIIVYECVRKSLKVVEINGFKGQLNELVVINYLLFHGLVLDTLSIVLSKEKDPDGADMESSYRKNAQDLLKFNRASASLRILIN
ncbi:putative F-box protein At3g29830 [Rhododendron vialii]|uniref:putative F-box protein At3g29830 n=1 Tax=Rhododendron vialii TaxID=182163 RepID=UPI00265EB962|nr:putative F-box protein At3g29830 [Rhododendron vialii]